MIKNVNKRRWGRGKYLVIVLFLVFALAIPVNTVQAADQQVTLWDGTTYSVGDGQDGNLVVSTLFTQSNGGQFTDITVYSGCTIWVNGDIYVQGSINNQGTIYVCNGTIFVKGSITGDGNIIAYQTKPIKLYVGENLNVNVTGSTGTPGQKEVPKSEPVTLACGGSGGDVIIHATNILKDITGGAGGAPGTYIDQYNQTRNGSSGPPRPY